MVFSVMAFFFAVFVRFNQHLGLLFGLTQGVLSHRVVPMYGTLTTRLPIKSSLKHAPYSTPDASPPVADSPLHIHHGPRPQKVHAAPLGWS